MRKLLATLLGLVLVGCSPTQPTPPGNTNQTVTVIINNGPSASPSPGGGGTETKPDSVKIAQFGEHGCSNPSGTDRTVRVGCTAALTCSPLIGGKQAPAGTFPPAPDSFGLKFACDSVQVLPSGSTAYNLDVKGVSPGTCTFECIVNGVSNVQTAGSWSINVVSQ